MGGEPTEHPEIKKILQYFLDNNIPFDLSTNGLFDEDLLNFFIENNIILTFSLHLNTLQDDKLYNRFKYNFLKIKPELKFLNGILFHKKYDNKILPLIENVAPYENYSVNLLHNTLLFKTKDIYKEAKKSKLFELIPFYDFKEKFENLKINCYFPKIDINPDEIIISSCFSPQLQGIYKIDDLSIFMKLKKLNKIPVKNCKTCSYIDNNDLNVLTYFKLKNEK